jgi:hypothetical protein
MEAAPARARGAALALLLAVCAAFDVPEYLKCQLCEVRAGGPLPEVRPLYPILVRAISPALLFLAFFCSFRFFSPQTHAPSGSIEDCCCDVETVDQANSRHFLPILHDLTKR